MTQTEIVALTRVLETAVSRAVTESSLDHSLFPVRNSKYVAQVFGVSTWTVRSWVKTGLLEARYQQLSGRVVRLLFTNRSLVKFLIENFPSSADICSSDFHPKSSKAQKVKQAMALKKLYARRRKPANQNGSR